MKISVCILTKNSGETLEKTLQSVNHFDEIIIIDDFSTDSTLKIAEKFNVKIYQNSLNDNFADQRNFALKKTSNSWVLFLDSDEYLSNELISEIKLLKDQKFNGYKIRRQEIWLGKKLRGGEWSGNSFVRLADKRTGRWQNKVHEVWAIDNTGDLNGLIIHNSNKSISQMIRKLNYYAKLHSEEKKLKKINSSITKIVFMPLLKFFHNFFWKKGFLDGTHGFVYTMMMSFHSFLAWSDLWILERKR